MWNHFKTLLLLVSLSALLLIIGDLWGGPTGLTIALIFALLMNGIAYWFSDRIVLMLHRAQPLSEAEAPRVHAIVRELSARAGIPMPRIYRVATNVPNAFATGRNPQHAAIAVTDGILHLLNEEELRGVLAHELSHVLNRDILVTTVAAVLASAIMYLARMAQWALFWFGWGRSDEDRGTNPLGLLAMAILAPIAALLIQLWVCRTREYMADERGARLVGRPDGLIRALQKIENYMHGVRVEAPSPALSPLYFARMRSNWLTEWFSTHPPVEKRVERLLRLFGRAV